MEFQYKSTVDSPKVLYEDVHLIVLSKPAGMLSQGEHRGEFNLVDWLRNYLGRNYVGLIHRLDRNTSGIMIVAKRTKAANRLTLALQSGELQRVYLGWVEGNLHTPVKWRHFLEKNKEQNRVFVTKGPRPGAPSAKEAILSARPRSQGSHAMLQGHPITLVEFRLETGRSHQIRVQAAHEGFPILGDQKYGSRLPFVRTALHSYSISFPHPMKSEMTAEPLTFTDPLPKELILGEVS